MCTICNARTRASFLNIFWDITQYDPSKVSRRFGVTYYLGLQSRALLAACFHAGNLLGLSFFHPEVGDNMFLRNVG
jgi:hypothetical protein